MITWRITLNQLRDGFRSRWALLYLAFFALATDALFRFGGSGERVIMSLLNVVLLVIPMVSLVLGAMYLYGAREYVELMLTQPIRRRSLYRGLYLGLTVPLVATFVLGVTGPFLMHGGLSEGWGSLAALLGVGALLTVAFVALAFVVALSTEDRIRGVGMALGIWLLLAVVYDGALLLALNLLRDFPLEKLAMVGSFLNPIDLGRILLLLNLEVSALMGYTGAVFQEFFGSGKGQFATLAALAVWVLVPAILGERSFGGKDF
jgi:Cu-processing system permease protein